MARRALALLALLPWVVAPADPGAIEGRVVSGLDGVAIADLGPLVVYLDSVDGGRLDYALPRRRAKIRQRDAVFRPGFLVVAAGQTVDMPNEDGIFHNVFSFSRPNDFDLGLYPSGESRRVTLRHAGLVRLYCSIHESMNGAVYVTPSPWYALPGDDGRFEIRGVPPGRYALRTWSERLPGTRRVVEVGAGQRLAARIDLSAGAPRASRALPSAAASR